MDKSITDLSAVTTVGLDLAKHVFQIHAVDSGGRIVATQALQLKDVLEFFKRLPSCLVGMEACGSAHHWCRQLVQLGHEVRLMPPAYVKAYVRRQKNALHSHLAEIGIIMTQGPNNARSLAALIIEGNDIIPATVRLALLPLLRQLSQLDDEIRQGDQAILALAKGNETAHRLMSVPGTGPITASALAASVQDISAFSGPRAFAAFLGLTPRQNSSGGKERLGPVSKMGNRYLRKLLVVGAHAVLFHRKRSADALRNGVDYLMQTKPFKLVAVATANKPAPIAFALMRNKAQYTGA